MMTQGVLCVLPAYVITGAQVTPALQVSMLPQEPVHEERGALGL